MITDYPANSYVLYTPPMGRSNKLLSRHRGPYQNRGRKQSIYIIEDLVLGKQIKTHVHNLRPLIFSPTRVYPSEIAQHNEQVFLVRDIIAHVTSWRSSQQKIQHGVPCLMDRL